MIRFIERAASGWSVVQRYTAALILIAMTGLYGFNVLLRATLPQYAATFAWIEEGARYMMVWVVFLASGVALEVGRHILIDLLWSRFGPRARRVVFAAIDLVGVLFFAGTGQISPTLGIPAYILYVAPVVGFVSLAFGFVLRLLRFADSRIERPNPAWLGGTPQ
jgi:TRAP-type C4-dicarboxylate transport system permease small subunit